MKFSNIITIIAIDYNHGDLSKLAGLTRYCLSNNNHMNAEDSNDIKGNECIATIITKVNALGKFIFEEYARYKYDKDISSNNVFLFIYP